MTPGSATKSQIRCRYCPQVIDLNPDNEQARETGRDPHQQMRTHILADHPLDIVRHTRRIGWLIDMMFFEAVNSPENWRKQIAELVDYLLKEGTGC